MTTDEIRSALLEYDHQKEKLLEAIRQKNENPDFFAARELVSTYWTKIQVIKTDLIQKIELL